MRRLTGLAEVAHLYDGFIVDLWGVIHDGVTPYFGALACLEKLKDRPVLLLSNAPRRAWAAREALRTLGIGDGLYTDLLTSGEATWLALRDRSDPWFAALGLRVYHLGPARDRSLIEGIGLALAGRPDEADFLLNTGPDDHRDGERLDEFVPELNTCLRQDLPMICANPDIEIVRGDARILCAGALAEYYAQNGGRVRSLGKPDPGIYDQAVAMIGVRRERLLAVGDSLRTDIAGAAAASIDAVWVLGGLHAAEHRGDWDVAEAAAAQLGLHPYGAVATFIW